ncbi:hypothetical protein TRFO_03351 [Tritrichomonas foetus]|uniref:PAS domain-containing protein n=1 Tax=Tritrichomonas foetus TaxID=1144522 RepID=A0A1J4KR57_9EUKA|nr:hypothetical protein TRFO_03351 [Tritrichomonas foetus]|eukprot:OHT13586.1 hypothetical protein TRFO_03351 [Tritrichomonas foetus]
MTYDDSPGAEQTLGSLLRSLTSSHTQMAKYYSKIFCFCHDIITISRLPNTVDTILWCIELGFFDFFILFVSCPFEWFKKLNITFDDLGTSKVLESKILLQQLAMLAIAITLLFSFFFWFSFIFYNPKKSHLSSLHATTLHFTVIHLPLIIAPIDGIIIGALLVSNINVSFTQYTTTTICISLGLCYILFITSNAVYTTVTNYSLTLSFDQFAYWRHPFRLMDHFVVFLNAMFIPIRMGYDSRWATFIAIIQFIYGAYIISTLKNITFVSLVALTIQIKISVDSLVFPIFTLVNVWMDYSNIMTFSILVILEFINTCASLIILSLLFNYSQTKLASFTQTKMPSSEATVSMLRFGINLSMKGVARTEFIKWIALWRFSFDLVPDLVRLCVVTRLSMEEIIIPHQHCGPLKQIPLLFLAYQLDLFQCYAANDGDQCIEGTKEDLTRMIKMSKEALKNFLIDPIYDQMSLGRLGSKLQSISNKFSTALISFPHSKEIAKLWNQFTTEIIYAPVPSQLKRKTPMETLYNPSTTIYGFLRSDKLPPPCINEKKESPVDWYFKYITRLSTYPMIIFLSVFYISFLINLYVIGKFTTDVSKSQLDHFINTSTFVRLQTELANEKLAEIEPYVQIPSYREISKLLGIDEETASTYVSKRISARSELSNLTSLYSYINTFPLPPDSQQCKDISFVLLLKYKLPKDSSIDAVYCQMLYINFYSQYIANISESIIWNFAPKEKIGYVTVLIYIVIFMSVSTAIFIIFLINDVRRRQKIIIAMKSVTNSRQSHRFHSTRYDLRNTVSFNVILWIIVMALTSAIYVSCVIPSDQENARVTRLLRQIAIISGISRSSQNSLAYSASHFMHNLTIPDIVGYLSNSREELVEKVNNLTEIGIDYIFQDIEPLNKWLANGTESFSSILLDYAQLLANKNQTNDFKFYYARYLFLFNISILIESTLPTMVDTAQVTMQKISSVYVISSVVILLAVFICMVLFYLDNQKKKTWYFAATTFLRRSIANDYRNLNIIQKALSHPFKNYIDELPYAFISREKNGPITYANSKTMDYLDYSPNQVIGQRLENIFKIEDFDDKKISKVKADGKETTLNFEIKEIDNNNEAIFINDITNSFESNYIYKEIIKTMRPNIPKLPFRDKMIYVEIRLDPNIMNPNSVFDTFDEADKGFKDAIRISCGVTYYTSIVTCECNFKDFIIYLDKIISCSSNNFILSVVYGIISCTTIDNEKARTLVCGNAVNRAHDCINHGLCRRSYIDSIIVSTYIKPEELASSNLISSTLIEISPLESQI